MLQQHARDHGRPAPQIAAGNGTRGCASDTRLHRGKSVTPRRDVDGRADAPDYGKMSTETDRTETTAVEEWSRRGAATPAATAFRFKEGGAWTSMTWGEADVIARELASGLAVAGIVAGDRVCLLSQSRAEWMLCDVAILLLGAITVPIYASNTPDQCAFIVKDCGARMVIVEDALQLEKMLGLRGELPRDVPFIYISGDATLERPDASGRTHVRIAEVRPAGDAGVRSLDELREVGRAHPLGPDVLAK